MKRRDLETFLIAASRLDFWRALFTPGTLYIQLSKSDPTLAGRVGAVLLRRREKSDESELTVIHFEPEINP